jgi:hypothetical protein
VLYILRISYLFEDTSLQDNEVNFSQHLQIVCIQSVKKCLVIKIWQWRLRDFNSSFDAQNIIETIYNIKVLPTTNKLFI